jgi:ribosomal protein S18 acetylase RimI-like enzyme
MATRTIRIRIAEPDDASGLAAVHDLSWAEAYHGIIPGKALNRMIERRGSEWWRKAIAAGTKVLVLDFHDDIAGYASFGRSRSPVLSARGEIYELYLAPEYQGIGLGRRLFGAARRELLGAGLDPVVVWSLADNERAIGFYAHLGGIQAAEGHEVFDEVRRGRVAFIWPRGS